jgi:hypothetical protein
MNPYIRWEFSAQFARDAVNAVDSASLLPALGILQSLGRVVQVDSITTCVESSHGFSARY